MRAVAGSSLLLAAVTGTIVPVRWSSAEAVVRMLEASLVGHVSTVSGDLYGNFN